MAFSHGFETAVRMRRGWCAAPAVHDVLDTVTTAQVINSNDHPLMYGLQATRKACTHTCSPVRAQRPSGTQQQIVLINAKRASGTRPNMRLEKQDLM